MGTLFLFMLLGAMMGITKRQWHFNLKTDLVKLIGSILVYYAILFAGKNMFYSLNYKSSHSFLYYSLPTIFIKYAVVIH